MCRALYVHMLPVIACLCRYPSLRLYCDVTQECRRVAQCMRLFVVMTACIM